MKHIAIYLRVSTKKQDTRSQEPDVRRWADGQDEPMRWYRDSFTGKTMVRPGWQRLMSDVAIGKVSQIVIWRLDRLGRTAAGLTALFDDLKQRRVGLVSLKDGFDINTPAGTLLANMLASVAQFETEVRMERVLAGQAAARAAGKRWGGSKKGRRLSITQEQVDTVKQLARLGRPKAKIARSVGIARSSVYAILAEA